MKKYSPRQIAQTWATIYSGRTFSSIEDASVQLIDIIEDAVVQGLDEIDSAEMASELKRMEHDKYGWERAYHERGDRHRAVVEAKDKEIADLQAKLSDMTVARNHAIEAAHLV